MRLLVCGGRDFREQSIVDEFLDRMHSEHKITCVIHGDARGADHLAQLWAERRGIPTQRFPAQWHLYGASAGPMRNAQMIREGKPTAVFAFPGGAGTANMVKQSEAAGLRVYTTRGSEGGLF